MKIKSLILFLVFAACNSVSHAKYFFDYKCQIVGISSNNPDITVGFKDKFFDNNIDFSSYMVVESKNRLDAYATLKKLQNANAGKMVLDYLLCYNGKSISDSLISERAYINRSLYDEEVASMDMKAANKESLKELLRENHIDVLKNNYIYLESRYISKVYWAVYHVDIDEEVYQNVLATTTNMQNYNRIKVNISLVAQGKSKDSDNMRNRLLRDISKKVAPFAIRGQVTREGGLGAYVGYKSGVWRDDRMYIYRQKGEGDEARSVKVATVRVTKADADDCKLYTIAGGFANSKKGDVAVLREDTRNNLSFYGMLDPEAYTFNFMYDHASHHTSAGTASHFLFQLGGGAFKNFDKYNYAIPLNVYDFNTYVFKAPVIAQIGIGYGYSWTLLHRLNIMPYVLLQSENLFMARMSTDSDVKVLKKDSKGNYSETTPGPLWGTSVKTPVGVKVSLNLAYPVQIFAGAEYNFYNFGIKNSKDDATSYETINKHYLEPSGYKRTGLNLYAGLRFCL